MSDTVVVVISLPEDENKDSGRSGDPLVNTG